MKTTNANDTTKTQAGKRVLNLFPTAEKCLLKIKQEQEMYSHFFKSDYQNTEGYIFTWEDGRSYDPNYISNLFQRATKEFGRPEITLHKLRHPYVRPTTKKINSFLPIYVAFLYFQENDTLQEKGNLPAFSDISHILHALSQELVYE